MEDVEDKFYKPALLVLETFGRELPTASVCLFLVNHRRYGGYEKYVNCMQKYLQSVVEPYVFHLLYDRFDLTSDYDLK